MKFKNTLLIISLIFTICTIGVAARFDTVEDTTLGIDSSLAGEVTEYGLPDSIVLGIINKPDTQGFDVDFKTWYSGVYYYQVTRFGIPSISFHYVISPAGELITNKNSQPERKINVEGTEFQNPILIGIFSQSNNMGFDSRLLGKIGEILLDIANKNSIPIEKIVVKDIRFEEGAQRNLVINSKEAFGSWNTDLQKLKTEIKDKYAPIAKTYKVDIVGEPVLPKGALKVNTEFEIKLKIKNTGENTIYGGSTGEFFLTYTGDGDKSKFYINDVWVSQTQAKLMKDGEVLKVNEEKEYIVKAKTPLELGNVEETFKLVGSSGKNLTDKEISINIKLEKPEGDIIVILDTETGYLKVRKDADFNSDEVERVSPGDRFFKVDSSNGFYQIDLGQGKKGWVYSKYVKSISP